MEALIIDPRHDKISWKQQWVLEQKIVVNHNGARSRNQLYLMMERMGLKR